MIKNTGRKFLDFRNSKDSSNSMRDHTPFIGERYSYKMTKKKGLHFSILWYLVIRKWGLEFLETFSILRNFVLGLK